MDYPKRLFKYQKFKEYSKEMLETGYIYFCPANDLDDLFECAISIAKEIINGNEEEYVCKLLPFIEKILEPYCNSKISDFDVLNCYQNGFLDSDKFKELAKKERRKR